MPKRATQKRPFVTISFLFTTLFLYRSICHKNNQLIAPTAQKNGSLAPSRISFSVLPPVSKIDPYWCDALKSHFSGHWHHDYAPVEMKKNDSEDLWRNFFPEEIQWLKGTNRPSFGRTTCNSYERMQSGKMYVTKLGNQCGCGLPDFKPSLMKWVTNETLNQKSPSNLISENYGVHSSLRLAHNLAESNHSHLCFVGDSIDFSIYDAFKVNLQRALKLQQNGQLSYKYPVLFVEEREFEVNVSRTDNGVNYVPAGWRRLKRILETEVVLQNTDNNKTSKFSYFQHYGWSPWDVELLEDCNIIVMNLSLHYESESGRGIRFGNPLTDDTRAAITALVNFTTATSKKHRIAIWRSTLPQHFDTRNGHFEMWMKYTKNTKDLTCVPLKISFREQSYNIAHKIAFDDMCRRDDNMTSTCSAYENYCTVNIREKKYQTTYQFRQSNNLTTWVDEGENPEKTGKILRWDIADLFDNHLWHSEPLDCSHYCYIPQVFDAAFERLGLLLGRVLRGI